MRKWALTLCAEASPNVTGPEAALNPSPHNRALRQNQDSRSSVVRPLRRHSKSRPTHHRSGKDRKPSIATLGEKSTQPSPCETPVKGSVPGGPRPTRFVKHEHRVALKTKTATPAEDTPVLLRSKSARTIRSGSLRSRQHIRISEPLRSHRTGLRLLNTDQVRSPAQFARRGGIAQRRLKQAALREDPEKQVAPNHQPGVRPRAAKPRYAASKLLSSTRLAAILLPRRDSGAGAHRSQEIRASGRWAGR